MNKIIDNFLDEKTLKELQEVLMGKTFPWYYESVINSHHSEKDNTLYFVHIAYHHSANSSFYEYLRDIFWDKLDIKSLIRIKVNCYPKTDKLHINESHIDYDFKHKAAVFSINTNNGGTYFSDKKVDSIENRIVLFDGNKPHSSSTCTNQKARFNINFNYF